jgi:hypothetical protein
MMVYALMMGCGFRAFYEVTFVKPQI